MFDNDCTQDLVLETFQFVLCWCIVTFGFLCFSLLGYWEYLFSFPSILFSVSSECVEFHVTKLHLFSRQNADLFVNDHTQGFVWETLELPHLVSFLYFFLLQYSYLSVFSPFFFLFFYTRFVLNIESYLSLFSLPLFISPFFLYPLPTPHPPFIFFSIESYLSLFSLPLFKKIKNKIDTCFFFSFRIYSLCLPCHFLYCVSASRLSFPVWVWLFWNPFLCHLLLLFFLLFFHFLVKLKNNSILLYLWTFALVNLQVQVKLSSGDFLLLFLLELCVNREVFRAIWSELLGCVSTGRCLEPYDQNC